MHVVLKIFDKMRIASAKFLSRSPIALTTSPSQATPPQHCNVVMAKELFGSHQLVDPIPFIHSESHRAHRREDKSRTIVHGLAIRCESDVCVRVGPVIGKVTSTTAIVLIEVSLHRHLVAHLIPFDSQYPIRSQAFFAPKNCPKAFLVEDLVPCMKYHVVFEGVNAKDAHKKIGMVRTMPEGDFDVRIAAVSCDSPDQLKDGETNMWDKLAEQVKADEVDVVLHLGDQVYAWKEFQDAQAMLRYSGIPRGTDGVTSSEAEVKRLHKVIKDRIRDVYRYTWNLPGTATVLSKCSNLMIWSDNDIINDFTVAKEEGQQDIEPLMLYLAHQVYREYQRQLWDVNYKSAETTDEFHYHKFGHTGIFINDIRGNRISNKGEQRPNNPLVNDKQWAAILEALSDPTLKNLLVCCEIPYLGNTPEDAKSQVAKFIFLADHWSYNDSELVKILTLVFDWVNAKKKERTAVLIGDIHAGVYTTVRDNQTNTELLQLTATPISNHVSGFFPALEGKVNDRFSFTHKPEPWCRNYAYVTTHVKGRKPKIDAKLILGAPIGHH